LIGGFFARQLAFFRRQHGTTVVIGGASYSCETSAVKLRQRDMLLDSVGGSLVDVADPDMRVFNLSPVDFPVLPAIGSLISWHGLSYTVIAVRPVDLASVLAQLRVFCYRSPAPVSASAGSSGSRVSYVPPDV